MRTAMVFSFLVFLAGFTQLVQADGLYSVHSPDGIHVWAVGNSGAVFRSTDAGATWTTLTEGSATLRSVFTYGSDVWIVGDNGSYYSSRNAGASWSVATLAGGTALRAIVFVNGQTGWVAGNSGTILKTTDGGSSWNVQSSTTSLQLNSLSFLDSQNGYAAGVSGTLLKTTNGGTTWIAIGPGGWTRDILSVSSVGRTVLVAGTDGFCYASNDNGSNWTPLDFNTDTKSDVNGVFALSELAAAFVGGGGFIRTTTDGGSTFGYGLHQLHAKLNSVFFFSASHGWACGEKTNVILRTTDGGATWQLPQGTGVNYQWLLKFTAGSIGNTFCVNPKNKDIIYVVMGTTVYMSGDRGDSWTSIGSIAGGGSTWSFYVSPKDTNVWIAATSGTGGKGVRRSTNRGVSWTVPLLRNFTSYGMPLEMDPDHPDTVIFAAEGTSSGPDGILYKSTDFGATWDTLAQTSFRSPCDIMIVPGNTNLWYVGDGVTGSGQAQMWRSTNYGLTWTSIYFSPSSEIPMIAVSRLRNTQAFATAWSSTSVMKSTNAGVSWSSIAPTTSTWGADVAKDDPNVVMYGTYGGSMSYLSTNAGSSFTNISLSGSNSGMLAYDRATFLSHQAGSGVSKLSVTYTVPTSSAQIITVASPNGGESWSVGSVQNIQWNSTGISGLVKIELSTDGGMTFPVVIASSTDNDGTEPWTVTGPATSSARIRISSVGTPSIADTSDANFAITQASLAMISPNGGEHWGIGTTQNIQWTSSGISGPVKIELSRNGGSTYETLFASTPNDGSEQWTVTGPITTGALVRISSINTPSIFAQSNSQFEILSLFFFISKLWIHDAGGAADSLEWGTGPGATDGIDPQFGEYEQPPAPPFGSFDVRWNITGTEGSLRDIRDTLGGARHQIIYTGKMQPSDAGYPFVLRWNRNTLPSGSFTIRDQFGAVTVNMKLQDSLVIADDNATTFRITYTDANSIVSGNVQQNWNIVSVPLMVDDLTRASLFPTSTSYTFAFTPSGYARRDTLNYGVGYWLKFPSSQNISLTGSLTSLDTIHVTQGWNIIGSISSAVPVGNIIQIPNGIVSSQYFGYSNGAYTPATTINPMQGYWVKVTQNGSLILQSSVVRPVKLTEHRK